MKEDIKVDSLYIKRFEFIESSIKTLKKGIVFECVNSFVAVGTVTGMNIFMDNYPDFITIPSVPFNIVTGILCSTVIIMGIEKIKNNKFEIDELEFEKEDILTKSKH